MLLLLSVVFVDLCGRQNLYIVLEMQYKSYNYFSF